MIESLKITPNATLLIDFVGDVFILKDIITLPVTIGKVLNRIMHIIDFLIMDHSGAYNIILGWPFLATTESISMHYLTMKVSTTKDVITIKGGQEVARGCYSITSKVSYQIAFDAQAKKYPA